MSEPATVLLRATVTATDETLAYTIRRVQAAGFSVQTVGRWCDNDGRWRLELTRSEVIP